MITYFSANGRRFIRSRPVKSMFNSSFIHDVVTSDRWFVTDLDTGEFTIFNPKNQEITPLDNFLLKSKSHLFEVTINVTGREIGAVPTTYEGFCEYYDSLPENPMRHGGHVILYCHALDLRSKTSFNRFQMFKHAKEFYDLYKSKT
jgi:hypothetical protein